jgi:capsular polysaccharide biosynthesis protein
MGVSPKAVGQGSMDSARRPSPGMDVQEIVRRVGVAYWPLILVLTAAGVAAPAAYHFNDRPVYTASVRFVVDASDPQITTQSTALADTVRSIATSPGHVAVALDTAGARRDATTFAQRNIRVQALGSSGVMQLDVRDVDRVAAAKIANALAQDVIATRATISRGEATEMVASLTAQINTLDTRISAIDSQTSHPKTLPPEQLAGLYSERSTRAQERLTLVSERDQINEQLALRPHGGIVDDAQPASEPDASRAPIDIALGFLGGLVLSIVLAAVLAVFRPRISGRYELEDALGALLLGDTREWEPDDGAALVTRVRLAARRARVTRLHVAALESSPKADSVVRLLTHKLAPESNGGMAAGDGAGYAIGAETQAGKHSRQRLGGMPARPQPLVVRPLDLTLTAKNGDGAQTGLLLVAPATVSKKNIEAEADLVALTGWPIAGIVTYGATSGRLSKAIVSLGRRLPWRT